MTVHPADHFISAENGRPDGLSRRPRRSLPLLVSSDLLVSASLLFPLLPFTLLALLIFALRFAADFLGKGFDPGQDHLLAGPGEFDELLQQLGIGDDGPFDASNAEQAIDGGRG